ncbi:hypothetical protein QCA50_002847 [Cerrena zonata]|uniref:GDS1 winged helix domain-containing protein n=1 Tax=Cerrena zonata TaxID=2478898 RepID=A0AAW0GV49_9APHY
MTAVATTLSSQHTNPATSVQHNYGTRIRSNSVIRPSVRLRQSPGPSPAPRKIRPVPTKLKPALPSSSPEPSQITSSLFPPPHVMLHSDDASSKVFIAIGKSFMSVNNRAMTIKDLAEMTMKFGLMCQNVSAAGQAITTYIRSHLQRCEIEQDHPLLLRHTLSGTLSDDELAPALHSRVGGAHCTLNSEGRTTNFRRGTMVWYLSRAAGAPCPFSRAGIQLSDYTENGKVGSTLNPAKERKRERDRLRRAQQCGQKRKRLPRACADKGAESDSSDEDRRPPKVKLTLRLRPSSASCRSSESPAPQISSPSYSAAQCPEIIDLSHDDDSDSESEDDSMSLESSESEEESDDDLDSWSPASSNSPRPASAAFDSSVLEEGLHEDDPVYSRSSIPPESDASASPPPDSEDEEDDFHLSMTGNYHIASDSYDEDDMDWHSDHMGDFDETDTQWGESPGPRSPSVQFEEEEVTVKQEPRDVRSLLEAWDDFDINISPTDMKVLDVVARAAQDVNTPSNHPLKVEPVDTWDWEGFGAAESSSFTDTLGTDEYLTIKQEEDDPSLSFDSIEPLENICQSPLSPSPSSSAASSPCDYYSENVVESRRPSLWHDAEILGPDSVKLNDLEEGAWHSSSAIQKEAHIEPSRPAYLTSSQCHVPPSISEQASSSFATTSSSLPTPLSHAVSHSPMPKSKPQLHPVQVSARETDYSVQSDPEEPVIVHTCQPCVPAICATELEGVSVYQMTLGSFMILRRIDTDFVNISPIYDFLGLPHPPLDIANAITVCQGSSIICGTWVPAPSARQMIGDQPLVNVFLSDQLNERFPPALQDFYRSNTPGRLLGQFGSHFRSTIEAKRESNSSFGMELPSRDPTSPWEHGGISPWDVEDHLLSVHPPFALAAAARPPPLPSSKGDILSETPLSPKRRRSFTHCVPLQNGSQHQTLPLLPNLLLLMKRQSPRNHCLATHPNPAPRRQCGNARFVARKGWLMPTLWW